MIHKKYSTFSDSYWLDQFFIYRFKDERDNVIYIGRTADLKSRIRQHFSKDGHLPKECYNRTKKIEYVTARTHNDMIIKEIYYIGKEQPEFNTQYKSGITIDIAQEYPDVWLEYSAEENINFDYITELKEEINDINERWEESLSLVDRLMTYVMEVDKVFASFSYEQYRNPRLDKYTADHLEIVLSSLYYRIVEGRKQITTIPIWNGEIVPRQE